ncbi:MULTISPECIES: RNA 2'-phosphotransferase [Sphingobacterium]|uniref:RNA 2'-phosphotransferase n=1 Tax=Sphingobacterium TaxID=28453 RepID=UPI00257CB87C|nr:MULTISPECIES: RNA 2'-phosphotransferase [Sphingobacterium]
MLHLTTACPKRDGRGGRNSWALDIRRIREDSCLVGAYCLSLDQHRCTDINNLIEKANNSGIKLDRETPNHIVATNSKKRFAFNDTLDRIKVSQGHSVEFELGYTNQKRLKGDEGLLTKGFVFKYEKALIEDKAKAIAQM